MSQMQFPDKYKSMNPCTLQLSDSHNQLEFLRSENQDLQADNLVLQRKGMSDGSSRRRNSRGGDSGAPPLSPLYATGQAIGGFADEASPLHLKAVSVSFF